MTVTLPRLSVVTFTNGPVPLIAASLRRLRHVAHEIVVAVDERVDPDTLGPLLAVADRVVRAEFVYPLEANLGWLHNLATGDWVLRLDGDDVASNELCRYLATPGWNEGITHAYLQYRWVWHGPGRMLDQAPWWPDPVLRLIARVPGIVHFPTAAHEVAVVGGHARHLDLAIYHLDLMLTDETTRAAKAARYERQSPGRRTDHGWSVSRTYYLPERSRPAPRTAPIPPIDRAAIEAILAANAATPPPPGGWPRMDPSAPVVGASKRRAPRPNPTDSRVRLLARDPLLVQAGRPTILTVAVTNRSHRTWHPEDDPPTRVAARSLDIGGAAVGAELRADLTGPVNPGQEALVRLTIPPVLPVRAQRLEVGLIQDGVAWHEGRMTIGLRAQTGRQVLVSTGVSIFRHLGDDLITREVLGALARDLPDVVPVLLAHPTDGLAARFGCEVVPSPASLPSVETGPLADPVRRSRELVADARRMAKGDDPLDPATTSVLATFQGADALVVAPGGGLASRYAREALFPTTVEVLVARAFGLPVFVEGPSIGPLEQRRDQAAITQLLQGATRVAVRDPSSADAARRLGKVLGPVVVPDLATAAYEPLTDQDMARAWLDDAAIPEGRPYAVVSLRDGHERPEHLATIRAALDALPVGAAAVYLPHCTGEHDDRSLLIGDDWARTHLAIWDPALGDHAAVALVAGALITVGSRFHLTVLAAAGGVPAVALAGSGYDRRRLRGHRDLPGVRIVERSEPEAVRQATYDLLAAERPEPTPHWDASELIEALAAALPAAPRLA